MKPNLVPTLSGATSEDIAGCATEWAFAQEGTVRTADALLLSDIPERGLCVLTIKRSKPPFTSCYALPGGKAEPGESLADAARRELGEEAGVFLKERDSIPLQEIDSQSWDPRFLSVKVGCVAAIVDPQTAIEAADDAISAQWLPVSHLASGELVLAFGHASWLEQVFQQDGLIPDENLAEAFRVLALAGRVRNRGINAKVNSLRKAAGAPLIEIGERSIEADRLLLTSFGIINEQPKGLKAPIGANKSGGREARFG